MTVSFGPVTPAEGEQCCICWNSNEQATEWVGHEPLPSNTIQITAERIHQLHTHCLTEWFKRADHCPLCRASISTDSNPYPTFNSGFFDQGHYYTAFLSVYFSAICSGLGGLAYMVGSQSRLHYSTLLPALATGTVIGTTFIMMNAFRGQLRSIQGGVSSFGSGALGALLVTIIVINNI